MPDWVIDYVLLHEIAHLVLAGHGPKFWKLLEGYPRTERARGYLEGVAAAAGLDLAEDNDVAGPDELDDAAESDSPDLGQDRDSEPDR
jgi:hypothetical protein